MLKRLVIIAWLVLSASCCYADEARMKDLYAQYGQLQIQGELLQNQILQVRKALAEEMQKSKASASIASDAPQEG